MYIRNRLISQLAMLFSFGVICLSFYVAARGSLYWGFSGVESSVPHYSELLGDNPIRIHPIPVRVNLPVDRARLARCAALIATSPAAEREGSARSRTLHVARLSRFLPSLPVWLERSEKNVVSRVLIGTPAFTASWRGIEVAERSDGRLSEHRDQMLSSLAESEVPLNAAIGTGVESFTVRDLLRTSMNEFHLGQGEISWTAVAYAHYLPPQSHWRNRLGERYSFDELAEELMGRPLSRSPCRGMHLLTALTTILLCDQEIPVLSPDVRDRVIIHLKCFVDSAVASQLADGSWPLCWAHDEFDAKGEFTPRMTIDRRIALSGHLLEWFHWLPKELKPPEITVSSGSLSLLRQLEASPSDLIVNNFCPYTHALGALFFACSP